MTEEQQKIALSLLVAISHIFQGGNFTIVQDVNHFLHELGMDNLIGKDNHIKS